MLLCRACCFSIMKENWWTKWHLRILVLMLSLSKIWDTSGIRLESILECQSIWWLSQIISHRLCATVKLKIVENIAPTRTKLKISKIQYISWNSMRKPSLFISKTLENKSNGNSLQNQQLREDRQTEIRQIHKRKKRACLFGHIISRGRANNFGSLKN